MPGQPGQQVGDVWPNDCLVLLDAKVSRDGSRVLELVETGFIESNGCRHHSSCAGVRHRCHNGARVDAARQKGAERHIAHQTQLDGLLDERLELFEVLVLAVRMAVAGERRSQ